MELLEFRLNDTHLNIAVFGPDEVFIDGIDDIHVNKIGKGYINN